MIIIKLSVIFSRVFCINIWITFSRIDDIICVVIIVKSGRIYYYFLKEEVVAHENYRRHSIRRCK